MSQETQLINPFSAHRALLKAIAEKQLVDEAIEQATERLVGAFARRSQ